MNGAVPRKSRKTEAVGVLCLAAAILLALCLYSYDPWDPSLNVASRQNVTRNYIGKAGAYTADLLLQTLGLASFLLVIPAMLLGITSFSGIHKDRRPLQRALGTMAIILCVAAGLEMFRFSPPYETNFSSGGILGRFMNDLLQEYFNFQGALIVLLTLLALALLLATNVSLQRLAKFLFLTPFSGVGIARPANG
jgi:DNA segregation ATPase FtsK/SpoIIIE, S-DNA-T family